MANAILTEGETMPGWKLQAAGGLALLGALTLYPLPGRALDWFNKKSDRPQARPSDCEFGHYSTAWRSWPEGGQRMSQGNCTPAQVPVYQPTGVPQQGEWVEAIRPGHTPLPSSMSTPWMNSHGPDYPQPVPSYTPLPSGSPSVSPDATPILVPAPTASEWSSQREYSAPRDGMPAPYSPQRPLAAQTRQAGPGSGDSRMAASASLPSNSEAPAVWPYSRQGHPANGQQSLPPDARTPRAMASYQYAVPARRASSLQYAASNQGPAAAEYQSSRQYYPSQYQQSQYPQQQYQQSQYQQSQYPQQQYPQQQYPQQQYQQQQYQQQQYQQQPVVRRPTPNAQYAAPR